MSALITMEQASRFGRVVNAKAGFNSRSPQPASKTVIVEVNGGETKTRRTDGRYVIIRATSAVAAVCASRVAKPSDIIAANHRTGEVLTVNKAEIPHEKHNADKIRGRAAPRR